ARGEVGKHVIVGLGAALVEIDDRFEVLERRQMIDLFLFVHQVEGDIEAIVVLGQFHREPAELANLVEGLFLGFGPLGGRLSNDNTEAEESKREGGENTRHEKLRSHCGGKVTASITGIACMPRMQAL